MKLTGFREIPITSHVSAMSQERLTISIDEAFRIGAINFSGNPYPYGKKLYSRRFYRDLSCYYDQLSELKFTTKDGLLQFRGFLAYRSVADLIECILSCYIPGGYKNIDDIFRNFSSDSERRAKLNDYFYHSVSERDRNIFSIFPALHKECVRDLNLEQSKSGAFFLTTNDQYRSGVVFILQDSDRRIVQGRNIPSLKCVTVLYASFNRFFALFNGGSGVESSQLLSHPYSHSLKAWLGENFVEQLEAHGESVPIDRRHDYILEPLCKTNVKLLIRVPTTVEFRGLNGGLTGETLNSLEAPRHLRKPLFIRDARTVGEFSPDVRIVDDLNDVLYLLSRTVNNIYVPGDAARNSAVGNFIKNEPYYLAGMEV